MIAAWTGRYGLYCVAEGRTLRVPPSKPGRYTAPTDMKKKSQRQPSRTPAVFPFDTPENKKLISLIADHMGDELMLIDRSGRIAYVNNAACRETGYLRSELTGRNITQIFKEKIGVKAWQGSYFNVLKRKRLPLKFVLERRVKGGHIQTIEVVAVYLRFKMGDYVLSIARNLSSHLKMERKLRESENRFRILADAAADGIFTVDLHGEITYANHALEELVKVPLKKSLGTHFLKYVREDDREIAMTCFHLACKGIVHIREELCVIDAEGEPIPIEVNVSPVYKDEKLVGIHGVVRDIRRRKQMDTMIRESEKRYRDLFEDANDALVLTDLGGGVLNANHQAETLFQRNRLQMMGCPQEDFFPAEQIGKYKKFFRMVREEEAKPCDLKIADSRGKQTPVSVQGRRINAAGRDTLIFRFIDLSERIRHEEELREMKKIEALQIFIAGTVQEIRYPLLTILNHTQETLNRYRTREFEYIGYREFADIIRTMEKIKEQVRQCCEITNKLLALKAHKTSVRKRECDVNRILRETVALRRNILLSANIDVRFRLKGQIPKAAMAPYEFEQVAGHVLTNSIEAMPSGGSITIRTYVRSGQDYVFVAFKDEGIGIARDALPHIFKPFFTTHEKGRGQGAGLGLSIVNSIITSVNGRIRIESSLRKGTSVILAIPQFRKKRPKISGKSRKK